MMLCVNRIMAEQEEMNLGRKADGFASAGCYGCSGQETSCAHFTPLDWIYQTEDLIPEAVKTILRTLEEQ